jgi:hypothetical protein
MFLELCISIVVSDNDNHEIITPTSQDLGSNFPKSNQRLVFHEASSSSITLKKRQDAKQISISHPKASTLGKSLP